MVEHLADAIRRDDSVLIVADFDADGATSCAVAMQGLRRLGATSVDFLVPNRFEHGYGLTPEIVAVAQQRKPNVLITVDNGISSLEGVHAAKNLGWRVLITDHHLPGDTLPDADAIVNPNLLGDPFPNKALAGVGVMFYVLSALRSKLRTAGWFTSSRIEPNLAELLDYVALGTVADLVPLDRLNRILVHQGLQRIRAGRANPGIAALLEVARKSISSLTAEDLGFGAAPRLNAAGRLEDMTLGIECLLADDFRTARGIAHRLDALNRQRKEIESQMKTDALALVRELEDAGKLDHRGGLCLFDASWHLGVVGLLASRIKDHLNRPVIAFARGPNGELKGSARSIPGLHMRDLLSDIATRYPKLLSKFGGHAMAAGLSLEHRNLESFRAAFEEAAGGRLSKLDTDHTLHSDGKLEACDFDISTAKLLKQAGPWGQSFPEPVFDGEFDILDGSIAADQHVKLKLRIPGTQRWLDGIAFFVEEPQRWMGCKQLRAAYRLDVNEFRNTRRLQLKIDYMESRASPE